MKVPLSWVDSCFYCYPVCYYDKSPTRATKGKKGLLWVTVHHGREAGETDMRSSGSHCICSQEENAGPQLLFTQSGTLAMEWRHLLSGWVFLPQLSSLQRPTLTNTPIEVSSGWFQVQSRSTMNIDHHKAVMWRVGWLLSSDNVLTASSLPSSPDWSFLDNGLPRRAVINKSLFFKSYLASAVMFKTVQSRLRVHLNTLTWLIGWFPLGYLPVCCCCP